MKAANMESTGNTENTQKGSWGWLLTAVLFIFLTLKVLKVLKVIGALASLPAMAVGL